MKRLLVVVGMAAMLASVAACGGPTIGQPTAQTTTTDGQPTQDGGSPTSTAPSSGSGGSLPVDHPCQLIPSADLQQLDVTQAPTETKVGVAPTCEFDSNDFTMDVGIEPLGLSQFVAAGGTVHDTTVNGRPAKEEIDNTGSCVIGMSVTNTSRVDVVVTPIAGGNPQPTAEMVAKLVEPNLP